MGPAYTCLHPSTLAWCSVCSNTFEMHGFKCGASPRAPAPSPCRWHGFLASSAFSVSQLGCALRFEQQRCDKCLEAAARQLRLANPAAVFSPAPNFSTVCTNPCVSPAARLHSRSRPAARPSWTSCRAANSMRRRTRTCARLWTSLAACWGRCTRSW